MPLQSFGKCHAGAEGCQTLLLSSNLIVRADLQGCDWVFCSCRCSADMLDLVVNLLCMMQTAGRGNARKLTAHTSPMMANSRNAEGQPSSVAKNGVRAMERTEPALKHPYKIDMARPLFSAGTHLQAVVGQHGLAD